MKVKVAAKLNISLNVFGVENGYHAIDSVATSVALFDVVSVARAGKTTVSGMSIPEEQNSAYKAAKAFERVFGVSPCAITVQKAIPLAGGLGGSSADAAAVIYCLCRTNGVDLHSPLVAKVCAEVGSDVNFMLKGGLGRMTGRGERVEFAASGVLPYFVITVFEAQSCTAAVYRRFDELGRTFAPTDNSALMEALKRGNFDEAYKLQNNFLQVASASLSPYAERYLDFCNGQGIKTTMTGSGSCYFVMCKTKREADGVAKALVGNGFNSVVCRAVKKSIFEI